MTCFFVLVGLLLTVTIVTFLRNVSLWPVLTASLVFFGMVLTFLLGAFVGYDHACHKQQLSNQSPDGIASSPNTISLIGRGTRKLAG
jgi:hypothetical protein